MQMLDHDYHRQLTAGERTATALFHLEGQFTATDLARLAGIDNEDASEYLDALEHLGVVTVVEDAARPMYQRADQATELEDDTGCDWCDGTEERLTVVRPETPAGEYLALSDGDTMELCSECMREVSMTVAEQTRESASGKEVVPIYPICQADSCEHIAAGVIPSEQGHPDDEWKLCTEHYREVGGVDPWYPLGHDWSLKKLYYRCPEGGKLSHNTLHPGDETDRYQCSCGEWHVPATIE